MLECIAKYAELALNYKICWPISLQTSDNFTIPQIKEAMKLIGLKEWWNLYKEQNQEENTSIANSPYKKEIDNNTNSSLLSYEDKEQSRQIIEYNRKQQELQLRKQQLILEKEQTENREAEINDILLRQKELEQKKLIKKMREQNHKEVEQRKTRDTIEFEEVTRKIRAEDQAKKILIDPNIKKLQIQSIMTAIDNMLNEREEKEKIQDPITPLHLAAEDGYEAVVNYLVEQVSYECIITVHFYRVIYRKEM